MLCSNPVATTDTGADPLTESKGIRRRRRANAEGGLWHDEKRRRWVGTATVGYDDKGRQIRRSVTAKTKGEAAARLRELQGAVEAGQELARRDLTVSRFLTTWLTDVLPGSVAPATEQQYRDIVRLYIKPHVGQKRLRTLQARDVTKMVRSLEADGRSPNTCRLARSILRRALRWAEHEGWVSRNVAAIAHGVKIGGSEGRTLTPDQVRVLLAHAHDHRLEAAVTVALALGLRLGEVLGVTWPDVDLDATPPRLTVRRALKRLPGRGVALEDTKTRQSRRTVHLPAPVVDSLRAHRRRQLEERLAAGDLWEPLPLGHDLVFRTPAGTALDPANVRHAVYSLTEQAGLGRWSPHELRHSAASLLLAMGVPLKTVSETLGHSSIRVTADVYGHLLEPAKAEAADAMTKALWP
jgi:integrase